MKGLDDTQFYETFFGNQNYVYNAEAEKNPRDPQWDKDLYKRYIVKN
jgi:hypothetical protein